MHSATDALHDYRRRRTYHLTSTAVLKQHETRLKVLSLVLARLMSARLSDDAKSNHSRGYAQDIMSAYCSNTCLRHGPGTKLLNSDEMRLISVSDALKMTPVKIGTVQYSTVVLH